MWQAPHETSMARTLAAACAAAMVTAAVLVPVLIADRGCGCLPPPPGPVMRLDVRQEGTNWSVLVVTVSDGLLPASTYLEVRTLEGHLALGSTPFGAMTSACWGAFRVLYRDANPMVDGIAAGDALVLDGSTYGSGTTFEIRYDSHTIAGGMLR